MQGSFLGLLGIAQRAGAVVSGTVPCMEAMKRGKGVLLIVASDSAKEVVERAEREAARASIVAVPISTREVLGNALGKSPRALVLVTDRGFGNRLLQLSQEK